MKGSLAKYVQQLVQVKRLLFSDVPRTDIDRSYLAFFPTQGFHQK